MLKKINYKPFGKKTNFTAVVSNGEIEKLENNKFGYFLKIEKNGHIPKTGIFLTEKLSIYDFENVRALDIGSGETGILAIHVAIMGAKEVIAIDIHKDIMKWAKLNVTLNNLNTKIKFKTIDIRQYKPSQKLDIIVSNPPQMPVKKIKSFHNDGGTDGRKYIDYIIEFSSKYLRKGGQFFLLVFDFLGVKKSYNRNLSIKDYSEKLNLKLSILGKQKKIIKGGSYTKKNLSWIHRKYPKYLFHKNSNGRLFYYVYIIRGEKL